MALPFPSMENVTSVVGLIDYVNTATGQIFGHGIILVIWVIAFLALSDYPKERSIAAASYITLIPTVLFWGAGLVSSVAVILVVVATIGSTMLILKQR